MTKRSIYVACGALVLAIGGFLASSANKKYAATLTAYFKNNAGTLITLFKGISIGTGAQHLTTTINANHTAFFKTTGLSTNKTLFASKTTPFITLFYK